jgi:hypothetical protein
MMSVLIGAAALAGAQAAPAPAAPATAAAWQPEPDLSWMAGYWLSCDSGTAVAETWSARRGSVMLGHSITTGAQAFSWEQMRIEAGHPEPETIRFFAQPRGAAAATSFRLVRHGAREAVFENAANDYPQRITYRREGEVLTARIEMLDGSTPMDWTFRSQPLNAQCQSEPYR